MASMHKLGTKPTPALICSQFSNNFLITRLIKLCSKFRKKAEEEEEVEVVEIYHLNGTFAFRCSFNFIDKWNVKSFYISMHFAAYSNVGNFFFSAVSFLLLHHHHRLLLLLLPAGLPWEGTLPIDAINKHFWDAYFVSLCGPFCASFSAACWGCWGAEDI